MLKYLIKKSFHNLFFTHLFNKIFVCGARLLRVKSAPRLQILLKIFRKFIVCGMIFAPILFFTSAFATKAEDDAQFLYLDAVAENGSEEKLIKAQEAYNSLYLENPKLEYKLRLASLNALKAKFFFMPNKKMEFANLSIREFGDMEAEILESGNKELIYEFHLYRGRTFINFPSMFKKKSIAIADIKTCIEMAKSLKRPSRELGGLFLEYALILKYESKPEEAKLYAGKALVEELDEYEIKKAKKLL